MIPLLTVAESSQLDASSPEPVEKLMYRAGLAVALAAVEMGMGYGSRVLVLAGPGNNGGDGHVAGAILASRGVQVTVGRLAPPKTEAAKWAEGLARDAGVRLIGIPSSHPADLVIDAVFGGGFRGGIPAELEPWFEADVPVLAVDVPTGLDPDTGLVSDRAFRARSTVTFHTPYPGHFLGEGPDRCGRLIVGDIGLLGGRPALRVVEAADAPRPPRARTAHKWSAGSVLVIGGSVGMVGAAVIAGRSALHFGAGAVGVASPNRSIVQSLAPELLAYDLDDLPDRYAVWLVGPGLGRGHDPLVIGALGHRGSIVLDADGLNAVTLEDLRRFSSQVRVLTPHRGEFARLSGAAEHDPDTLARVARDTGSTIVLKGNPTLVTGEDVPWVVTSNGPELATIGTGDVLAGMTAALLARGLDAAQAARSAAYWHGIAGADLARTETVTADRLARHVGRFAWETA